MKLKGFYNRILSMLLALAILISMCPTPVLSEAEVTGTESLMTEEPGEETAQQQELLQEVTAEEAPAEEAIAEEVPAEEVYTEEGPTEEAPTEEAPTEEAPAEEAPTEEASTEEVPTEEVPSEEVPTEEVPTETPTEDIPVEEEPQPTKPIPEILTPQAWWESVKYNDTIYVDAIGLIQLSYIDENLSGKTVYLMPTDGSNMDLRQRFTVDGIEYSFQGLGTERKPFNANLGCASGEYGITLSQPLFNWLDVSISFYTIKSLNLKFVRCTETDFAANIIGKVSTSGLELNVNIERYREIDGVAVAEHYIGNLMNDAKENGIFIMSAVTSEDESESSENEIPETEPIEEESTEPTEEDPTEPTEEEPTEPTEEDPTEPTEEESTEPTEEDPTEPTEEESTEPTEEETTEPTEEEPTEPTEADPTEPIEADPTEPTEEDPTEPTEEEPTEPTEEDPTEPAEEDPTEPTEEDPTEPTEEDPTEPTEEENEETDSIIEYMSPLDWWETVKENNVIIVDAIGLIQLSYIDEDLSGKTILLTSVDDESADLTQSFTVDEITYSFRGLGSESQPFRANLESEMGAYEIILNRPLFNWLDASVSFENFETLNLQTDGNPEEIFASRISGPVSSSAQALFVNILHLFETEEGAEEEYFTGLLMEDENGDISLILSPAEFDEKNAAQLGTDVTPEAWWEAVRDEETINVDAVGLIQLSYVHEDLSDKVIYLSTLAGDYADLTQTYTIGDATYSFQGLGSSDQPFNAVLESQTSTYGVILNRPLFNNLDASMMISNLTTLKLSSANDGMIMFADQITGNSGENSPWENLTVIVEKKTVTEGSTTTESYPGALIGTLNASFSLGTVTYSDGAAVTSTNDNAGLICNTMMADSSLTIGSLNVAGSTVSVFSGDNYSAGGFIGRMETSASFAAVNVSAAVSSVNIQGGNAGGLAGSMDTEAAMSVGNAFTVGASYIIQGGYAGGLVGSAAGANLSGLHVLVENPRIMSKNAGGGIFGRYTASDVDNSYEGYDGSESSDLRCISVTHQTTDNNASVGGVVGLLELNDDFVISNAVLTVTIQNSQPYTAGLVGKVVSLGDGASGNLRALTISGTNSVGVTNSASLNGCGGAVAVAGDGVNGVYVNLTGSLNFSMTNAELLNGSALYYGGFISRLMGNSVAEISEGASLTPDTAGRTIRYGGGVVGYAAAASTLRMAGTTDLSNTKYDEAKPNGQIVGESGGALIYGAQSWSLVRPSIPQMVDDIGSFGSVIRLGRNIGQGTSVLGSDGGISVNLISQDSTTHKTVYEKTLSGNTISDADDFVLAAIAAQQTGTLPFSSLVFGGDIDLRNTGLSTLQRDITINDVAFAGDVDGGGHTVTLDIGQVYGTRSGAPASEEVIGSGQIHKHTRVGMFAQFKGSHVQNLNINGSINVWEGPKKIVGGFAANNSGQTVYDSVNTGVTINCYGSGDQESAIGGLIGRKESKSVTVNSSQCSAVINGTNNTNAYFGGLVGYLKTDATFTDVTLSGTINMGSVADARVGGLAAKTEAGKKVYLNSVSVSGQKITAGASGTCGGLLGYDWAGTTYFNTVSVEGNSEITLNGSAECGALVYTAMGYWQVNKVSLQQLSVTSQAGNLGLLVCRGIRTTDSGTKGLYLELTAADSYPIAGGEAVRISSAGGNFDELCVYTTLGDITQNGNAVISIATANGKVDESAGNSYQNRTTNSGALWSFHPYNRYYYNLNSFTASGAVDTPEELTLWSAYHYSQGVIDESLLGKSEAVKGWTIGGGDIDLTGYSYYPITVHNTDMVIQECSVRFANALIEASESAGGTDGLVRTTRGTDSDHTPHYLMHTGLILDFVNTSEAGSDDTRTLTVSNAAFAGNVGPTTNQSGTGAIVSRSLRGSTLNGANHFARLNLNGVTLSGLYTNPIGAMLINNVGSYSNLSVNNVTTEGYTGYSSENPAASSLIGNVGSENGAFINLAFENINLSGRTGKAWEANTAAGAGTGGSIFSHATLLESFQYADGASSGYYHFVATDQYTFGKEISESVENAGLQTFFYQTHDSVQDGGNSNFSVGYLPYVCKTRVNDSSLPEETIYHELEVNVITPDLIQGCGTYDDPYIISNELQLNMVAQYINTGVTTSGWKVNKDNNPNGICTEAVPDHTEIEAGSEVWDQSNMRAYLLGAYYYLQPQNGASELNLGTFAGLGTNDNPFTGVIEGNGKTVTIDNQSNGLINVAAGCVVRNLSLVYSGTVKLTGGVSTNAVENNTFFGGIIGTVKGGDNLIEAVTVSFGANFSLTLQDQRHCAGGFVGLVQGGGVILRNMSSQGGLPGTDGKYRDVYFGRVLDGYVISDSVPFAGKNYSVPVIDGSASLAWNGGNISISNKQQLVMLCDIINSGAANNGASYAYGSSVKRRNADYSKIGSITSAEDAAFAVSVTDDARGGYPYLLTNFTDAPGSFITACSGISLTFQNSVDVREYGNGYRGIGGRYSCTANGGNVFNNTPKIITVQGNNALVQVAVNVEECPDDNFITNSVGGLFNVLRHNGATIENLTVSGSVRLSSGCTANPSALLQHSPAGGVIGQDIAAQSNTAPLNLNNLSFGGGTVYAESAAGGLIGISGTRKMIAFGAQSSNFSVLKLNGCSYSGAEITGGNNAGGLAGVCARNIDNFSPFSISGPVPASDETNGIIIIGCTGSGSTIKSFVQAKGTDCNLDKDDQTGNGVGGFIGTLYTSCFINKSGNSPVVIENVRVHGTSATVSFCRVGGVIGFASDKDKGGIKLYIRNVTVSGSVIGQTTSKKEDNAGGILGTWYGTGGLTMDSCTFSQGSVYGNTAGGLIGWADRSDMTITNSAIENLTAETKNMSVFGSIIGTTKRNLIFNGITCNSVKIKGYPAAGGLVGTLNGGNGLLHGNNVRIRNFQIMDYEQTSSSKGRITGSGNNTRVIGVSVWSDESCLPYLPARDIGNLAYKNENGYLNGTASTKEWGNKNFVIYDYYSDSEALTGSDLALNPAANKPVLNLHGDTVFPGRVLSAGANTVLYQNRTDVDLATGSSVTLFPGTITVSTYNEHQEEQSRLADEDNFSVLLIDGDASSVRSYLNAATNGGFETMFYFEYWNRYVSSGRGSKIAADDERGIPLDNNQIKDWRLVVSIDRYVKNGDATFVKADPAQYPATLKYHVKTGEFTTTAYSDNLNDTFTLITVTFTGKNLSYKREIHIPVIVRRMLQIDFIATMASGTVFNAGEMNSFTSHALASKGEDITGYLTFRYNSNGGEAQTFDWLNYMEAGANLLGYFEKTVDTGMSELPAGTSITLIDCQNNDRSYYTVVGEESRLELFSNGKLNLQNREGELFEPKSFSVLLDISAEEAAEGRWVRLTGSDGATVQDKDGNYYRLKQETGETSSVFYNLTIGNACPEENYFVVISVPYASTFKSSIDKSGFKWNSTSTSAIPIEVHQIHRYNNQPVGSGQSEASYNFLDNYAQNLENTESPGGVPIDANVPTVEIPIRLTNTVTFNRNNYASTDAIYQQFVVNLRKTVGEASTDEAFPSDAYAQDVKLYAYYMDGDVKHYFTNSGGVLSYSGTEKVAAATYDWNGSGDGFMHLPFASDAEGTGCINLAALREASRNPECFFLEVEADVCIPYSSVFANQTIPGNESEDEIVNYTQVYAASRISFTKSGLNYSKIRGTSLGSTKYYLKQKQTALLRMDYVDLNQLGINPRDDTTGMIDTILTFDLSGMDSFRTDPSQFALLNQTGSIAFTFTLMQKQDDGEYTGVEIGAFHSGTIPESVAANSYTLTISKDASGTWPYYNAVSGTFAIPVSFDVNRDAFYANYRIYAHVTMTGAGGADIPLAANEEKAFITYTLAKINVGGIWVQ